MTQYTIQLSESEIATIENALIAQATHLREILQRNEELENPFVHHLSIAIDDCNNALMQCFVARTNESLRIRNEANRIMEVLDYGDGNN